MLLKAKFPLNWCLTVFHFSGGTALKAASKRAALSFMLLCCNVVRRDEDRIDEDCPDMDICDKDICDEDMMLAELVFRVAKDAMLPVLVFRVAKDARLDGLTAALAFGGDPSDCLVFLGDPGLVVLPATVARLSFGPALIVFGTPLAAGFEGAEAVVALRVTFFDSAAAAAACAMTDRFLDLGVPGTAGEVIGLGGTMLVVARRVGFRLGLSGTGPTEELSVMGGLGGDDMMEMLAGM